MPCTCNHFNQHIQRESAVQIVPEKKSAPVNLEMLSDADYYGLKKKNDLSFLDKFFNFVADPEII